MKSILKKILSLLILFVLSSGITFAQNEIIFEENFNDNSKNWNGGLDSNEFSEIKDGKYYIENRDLTNTRFFSNNIPLNKLSNLVIETSIENIDTLNPNSTIGICVRSVDKTENYVFYYCSSRKVFSIIKYNSDSTKTLVGWTNNIAIDSKKNNIKIVKKNNICFFCINNSVLTHIQINTKLDNQFIFRVSNLNKIKIDYLNLSKLNNNTLIDKYWKSKKHLIFLNTREDYKKIININKKALVYFEMKDYKKSIFYYNSCLNYKLYVKDEYILKKSIADIYSINNINNLEAYSIFNELYNSYFKDFEHPIFLDSNEVQLFYNNFGAVASRLGKSDIALNYYLKALKYGTITNQSELGALYVNIGNIYVNKFENILAMKYFEKGYNYLEKYPNKFANEYLNRAYSGLLLISQQLGLRENVFIYANKLYEYASLTNDKNNILISLYTLSNNDDSTIAINASIKAFDFSTNNNYFIEESKINLITTKARFGICNDNDYFNKIKNIKNINTIRSLAQACYYCELFEKGLDFFILLPDTCTTLNFNCKQQLDNTFIGEMYYLTNQFSKSSSYYSIVIKNDIDKLMNYNNLTPNEKEINFSTLNNSRNVYYSLFENEKLNNQANSLINLFALNQKNLISKTNINQKISDRNLREIEKLNYTDLLNSLKNKINNNTVAIDIRKYKYFNIYNRTISDSIHYTLLAIAKDTTFSIYLKNGNELENQLSEYTKHSSGNLKYKKDTSSYQLFWAEIDKYLKGYDKVYICPDGVFSKINIESLYDKSQNQYVGDKYNVELVRNLGDIVNRKDTIKPTTDNETIVLMGGADYDNKPNFTYDSTSILAYNTTSLRDGVQGKLQYLPGTKKEVEVIGELLKKQGNKTIIYTGKSASEENVKAIKKPKIWHIATHGFFLENTKDSTKSYQEPLLKTGLYLSGANITRKGEKIGDDKDDGVFTAFEALNLDLTGTELVVLSACGTGKGDVKDGEGIYGLPRAIMEAGAESVLMSMWNVDDIGTMEYMKRFYTFRSKGLTNRESYQKTVLSLKNDPEFNYPYYWASFILIDR